MSRRLRLLTLGFIAIGLLAPVAQAVDNLLYVQNNTTFEEHITFYSSVGTQMGTLYVKPGTGEKTAFSVTGWPSRIRAEIYKGDKVYCDTDASVNSKWNFDIWHDKDYNNCWITTR